MMMSISGPRKRPSCFTSVPQLRSRHTLSYPAAMRGRVVSNPWPPPNAVPTALLPFRAMANWHRSLMHWTPKTNRRPLGARMMMSNVTGLDTECRSRAQVGRDRHRRRRQRCREVPLGGIRHRRGMLEEDERQRQNTQRRRRRRRRQWGRRR